MNADHLSPCLCASVVDLHAPRYNTDMAESKAVRLTEAVKAAG
jgi:hypothetical protein